jgi:hypothetical protein
VIAAFIIPDWPQTAKFLTTEERTLLNNRLRSDVEGVTMSRLDKKAAKRAFSDIKIYFGCVLVFLDTNPETNGG